MSNNRKVAFVGAGLIGTGLALNCMTHGVPVALQTRSRVELCKSRISAGLDFFAEHGIIDAAQKPGIYGLAAFTTSVAEAVSGASFIQESGPDKLEHKHVLIAEIEAHAPADAVIATSTSSQSITSVFAKAARPGRCMGGHPYLPAHLIPLIEITKGEKTEDIFVEQAREFYASIGKEPVVLNLEVIGFIANRFQSAIHREVVDLVDRGVCSVEDADKALVYSVGMRWGILGQYLAMHLSASPEGIGEFNKKYNIDVKKPDARLSALASWNVFPEDWCEKAKSGIEEEIARRRPETGNDIASIEKWRDKMLVELLRLHEKL
ncbi:MAG: 3-hydroxyacyl-CoA dehydrogenase family protein [Candidatus Accumulibacter sp.]|jgi:3-hydroxyacyl-CoA dehydrogenase|nr:3-hydroxyacyl-CoA dehydrogenase family protein [Accumulibacter sp.]